MQSLSASLNDLFFMAVTAQRTVSAAASTRGLAVFLFSYHTYNNCGNYRQNYQTDNNCTCIIHNPFHHLVPLFIFDTADNTV